MAGEPELRAGDGGEWVLYLQQSLNHHYQQQVIAETGEFDAALDGVVRHFQAQQGVDPTGIADAATWQALTGTRYRWPDGPVATAEVRIGDVTIHLALTLTGEAVDALADLTVEHLSTELVLTCPGATFLPGTAEPLNETTVQFTGTCALPGAEDATGYVLAVTLDPAPAATSVTEWLAVTDVGVVALPVTAGLEEVA
ncbi:MAG: peptidoglycan-binding protein [Actinomycetota bacterium]|nr:peptidoglycan-binding protein [Actinomycetota bacterium]